MRKIQVDDHDKPYMPQLDGLRAFAVGAVRRHHFSGKTHPGQINLAILGVWLILF